MAPSLFLVAGEVSGDIYGADLAAALRRLRPDLDLVGVGGPRMAAAGVRCLLDSSEWGLIGWLEALPHLPAFLVRLAAVARAIARIRPGAVVLIDFPGFNLALARRVGRRFPLAYYIPPMVSTRRGDRARRIARLPVRLLAVFPFEADAYRVAGADAAFIGHPALDRVRASAGPAEIRQRWALPPGAAVVTLLPGSRRQELRRHLPVMVEALGMVRAHHTGLHALLPVASEQYRRLIERQTLGSSVPIRLVPGGGQDAYDALAASDFAVVASGTATLEAMCLGVPMVVVYRLSPSAWWIIKRVVSVPYAALPSMLAGRMVVPELIQDAYTSARLAEVVIEWLSDHTRRMHLRNELLGLRARLGEPGAVERAAHEILRLAALAGSQRPEYYTDDLTGHARAT